MSWRPTEIANAPVINFIKRQLYENESGLARSYNISKGAKTGDGAARLGFGPLRVCSKTLREKLQTKKDWVRAQAWVQHRARVKAGEARWRVGHPTRAQHQQSGNEVYTFRK